MWPSLTRLPILFILVIALAMLTACGGGGGGGASSPSTITLDGTVFRLATSRDISRNPLIFDVVDQPVLYEQGDDGMADPSLASMTITFSESTVAGVPCTRVTFTVSNPALVVHYDLACADLDDRVWMLARTGTAHDFTAPTVPIKLMLPEVLDPLAEPTLVGAGPLAAVPVGVDSRIAISEGFGAYSLENPVDVKYWYRNFTTGHPDEYGNSPTAEIFIDATGMIIAINGYPMLGNKTFASIPGGAG